MSLDNFFTQAGSQKKKIGRKKGGISNANATSDSCSQGEVDPEEDTRDVENGESSVHRDKLIVESVTANIEKMLDSKLANVIKPVSEVAEKTEWLNREDGDGRAVGLRSGRRVGYYYAPGGRSGDPA